MKTKKWALVTGANGGLGSAIARRLAMEQGFAILAAARSVDSVDAIVAEIRTAGGVAEAIALDVTHDQSFAALYDTVSQHTQTLDVLINCAGVNTMMMQSEQSILTVASEDARTSFDVNALGALRTVQTLAPLLRAASAARIVNISTEMASLDAMSDDFYPIAPSYRISKAALNAITVLLAREFAESPVRVNAYSPGWLRTNMGGPDAPFSAEEGAETALYLATLDENGPNGGFFAEMRRIGGPVRLEW